LLQDQDQDGTVLARPRPKQDHHCQDSCNFYLTNTLMYI